MYPNLLLSYVAGSGDGDNDAMQGVNLNQLKRHKKLRKKGVSVAGGKADICYISLKPFSKKERKRQQKLEPEVQPYVYPLLNCMALISL